MENGQKPAQRRVATWSSSAPGGARESRIVASRATTIAAYSAPVLVFAASFAGLFTSDWTFFLASYASFGVSAAACQVVSRLKAARARKEAAALLEQVPEGIPSMAVRMSLHIDGHRYGEDVGALALVDGWLIFEGSDTCFSLAPYDLVEHTGLERKQNLGRIQMTLFRIWPKVQVRFTALRTQDDPGRLLSSYHAPEIPSETTSVLPPLEPQPHPRWPRFLYDPGWEGVSKVSNLWLLAVVLGIFSFNVVKTVLHARGFSEIAVLQGQFLWGMVLLGVWGVCQERSWRLAKQRLALCGAALPVEDRSAPAVLESVQQRMPVANPVPTTVRLE